MSISLTALPPEILSCIVAQIASQLTLRNLARCSRQLYLCTIPHLYRHVALHEVVWQGKQRKGKLRNLTSLLIRRPDLAGLVRQFTLHVGRPVTSKFETVGYDDAFEAPKECYDRVFIIDAHASGLSPEEKINCLDQFSPFHTSYHDFILALLLPALLKVEKLVLDLRIRYDTYYLEEMIRSAACRERSFDTQPLFEKLTVFVHSHNSLNARSPGFIASLLKLPAIQKISGGFGNKWNDSKYEDESISGVGVTDKNLLEQHSSSSPLTSLDLEAYQLSTADLDHILRAPKALKTLFYKVCLPDVMDFTGLRHALGPQEKSLESLDLDVDNLDDEISGLFGAMASFSSFNALKVFKAPAVFLITTDNGTNRENLIDIFPPNLETLCLTRFHADYESLLEALEYLLTQKSLHQIPSLKSLIIEEASSFELMPVGLMNVLWKNTQEIAIERLGRVAAAQSVFLDVKEELVEQIESPEEA
ncbi:hypothetical protein MMC22_009809 [Lobaria immixta]|nr:hypothetical protein [Lobaria immixta]